MSVIKKTPFAVLMRCVFAKIENTSTLRISAKLMTAVRKVLFSIITSKKYPNGVEPAFHK